MATSIPCEMPLSSPQTQEARISPARVTNLITETTAVMKYWHSLRCFEHEASLKKNYQVSFVLYAVAFRY